MTLTELIAQRRVLICVGSGGVGKTTTAAAIGVAAARQGRRTVVLTVDPAQRLKDALGIDTLDGRPRRVPLGRGHHLDAMLLDVKRTFDELVRGLATSPEQAARVLENRLYQNLSSTLAGTAEYMAIETVQRLVDDGRHDLLVVDTPPARHAVDFLDAPRRLLALLDSRVFAILKDPTSILPAAGSRIAHLVLGGILRGLERFTGVTLVHEIGEFIGAIEALTGALRLRVAETQALLRSDATSLILVTAPEPRLTTETAALVDALRRVQLRLDGVIVNRALPQAAFGTDVTVPPLPVALGAQLEHRLRRTFEDLRTLAARERATLAPLLATAGAPIIAEVPLLAAAPAALDELLALGRHLTSFDVAAATEPARGRGLA
jgi:anion-transporting  ArsA/GET3 family ATPase